MRRLTRVLRRRPSAPLELTAFDLRQAADAPPGVPPRLAEIASEIDAVARYVATLKQDIAVLRPAAMRDTLASDLDAELEGVRQDATAAAAAILGIAESIRSLEGLETGLRAQLEAMLAEIAAACAFSDRIEGRIARAQGHTWSTATRLARFVEASRVADAIDGGEGSGAGPEKRPRELNGPSD